MRISLIYNYTGYDITNYFRSEVIAKKKLSIIPPPLASGRISRERFLARTTIFFKLIGDNRPHNPAGYDVTISASSRLPNVIKYCTKVRKRVRTAKSRIIQPLFNLESPNVSRKSVMIRATATLDMTSPAASGRH